MNPPEYSGGFLLSLIKITHSWVIFFMLSLAIDHAAAGYSK